ncbi:MAG TPA: transposase [Acidimicrobiales bacterium]|nr:transposase [Acidimicrobiales bacterium]
MCSSTIRYNYRLRVSPQAESRLRVEGDSSRWVWNRCVEESKAAYRASTPTDKITCGPAKLCKDLTRWRSENEWLKEASSVVQQQTIRDFGRARSKALKDIKDRLPIGKHRGLPRFKSRHRSRVTLNYVTTGFTLHEQNKPDHQINNMQVAGRQSFLRLHLAGDIVVHPVWSRELPSVPSSVRVYQDAVGDWWASFVVQVERASLPENGRVIGVDWGVKEIATTTDDAYDFPHFEHGASAQARLARYQRQMARRRPQRGHPASNGYQRAKRDAAETYRAVARQRQDGSRKWAKSVVMNHDQIAVEDFKPKFLAKTTMAKKAADGAVGSAKRELVSMALKHGRDLRLVDPKWTTMDCSKCGARTNHRLPLSQRTYTCEVCGLVSPRDKNSAAVMVVRAGFNPAGVDGVRPECQPDTQAA